MLVTACVYLVLFCFQVQNPQYKPRISFQLADPWPLVALGVSGVPKGHHPRLQNCLANGLGPLSEPKREVLFIYFQFWKTKPELQLLCYSLSIIIIIIVVIIIFIKK